MQRAGIAVYVDVVMNHKAGADETEEILEPFDIEGWTKFILSGRKDQYPFFKWNFEHLRTILHGPLIK